MKALAPFAVALFLSSSAVGQETAAVQPQNPLLHAITQEWQGYILAQSHFTQEISNLLTAYQALLVENARLAKENEKLKADLKH